MAAAAAARLHAPDDRETDGDARQAWIRGEQARSLYKHAPFNYAILITTAIALCAVLQPVASPQSLLAWLGVIVALTAARMTLYWRFVEAQPVGAAAARWGLWYMVGVVGSGLAWGAAGVWLFPVGAITHQVLIAFVLGAICAAGVTLLSAYAWGFLAFAVPALSPLAIRLLAEGDDVHVFMGVMTPLYAGGLAFISLQMHRTVLSGLQLHYDNLSLHREFSGSSESYRAQIDDYKRAEARLAGERELLERVARGGELQDTLRALALTVERLTPGALAAVLVLERSTGQLRLMAAPNLPSALGPATEDLVGRRWPRLAERNADGAKAFVIEDLATQPSSSQVSALALKHGLHSCWSAPLCGSNGAVTGALVVYHGRVTRASSGERQLIQAFANLAGVAIERERADVALKASEARYRDLYEHSPSMYFTVDADGIVLSANRLGATALGYEPHELPGCPIFTALREDESVGRAQLATWLAEPRRVHQREVSLAGKDGRVLWVRQTARVIEDHAGERTVLIVCEDITKARAHEQQLSYHATHDALTELVNRRELVRRLERVVETAQLTTTHHALCYLDLDRFKVINDTCGHRAGDELLKRIAAVLSEQVRVRDTVARLGGDEFAVLMEHCSLKRARRIAQSVCVAVESTQLGWGEARFDSSVSVGLVAVTAASGSVSEILEGADSACYAAKKAGGNRVHVAHAEASSDPRDGQTSQ